MIDLDDIGQVIEDNFLIFLKSKNISTEDSLIELLRETFLTGSFATLHLVNLIENKTLEQLADKLRNYSENKIFN